MKKLAPHHLTVWGFVPAVKLLSKSQDGRGSYVIEYIEIYLYRGGHGYCGIELFSKTKQSFFPETMYYIVFKWQK